MKCLCVAGLGPYPQQLYSVLLSVGMKSALPAASHPPIDITSWHEQVAELLNSLPENKCSQPPVLGRMWERLASEIFLANAQVPLWGWYADRNLRLLEFWAAFDPRVNFVLLLPRLDEFVAMHLEPIYAGETQLESIVESWVKDSERLVAFGVSHAERCLILDGGAAMRTPADVIVRIGDKWGLRDELLGPVDKESVPELSMLPIAQLVAQSLVQGFAAALKTQSEVLSKFDWPVRRDPKTKKVIEARALLASFHALADRSSELGEIRGLQERCQRLQEEALRSTREREQERLRLEAEFHQALSSRDEELRALRSQLLAAQEYACKKEQEINALDRSMRELVQHHARNEQALEQRLREAYQENSVLLSRLSKVVDQNEVLQIRVNQWADTYNAKLQELRASEGKIIESAKRARDLADELGLARDTQKKYLEHIKQLEAVSARISEKNSQLTSHIVILQDELETALIRTCALQDKYSRIERRFSELKRAHPQFLICDELEVRALNAERLDFVLKGVSLLGRDFDELRFALVLEHGMAGLIFPRIEANSRSFFDNWELMSRGASSVTLLPIGKPEQVQERAAALLNLGTSDWLRLKALTSFICEVIERRNANNYSLPKGLNAAMWKDGLVALLGDLEQFPPVVRYDRIKLKRNQVNFDYEHLWFVLENFSYGENRWPQFEIRISCAEIHRHPFGAYPKLEFPKLDVPVLGSWFVESTDDFGEKLELRYALPDSMDMQVWHSLSSADQSLLRQVIRGLPTWLEAVVLEGGLSNRAALKWQEMVKEIQRITNVNVATKRNNVAGLKRLGSRSSGNLSARASRTLPGKTNDK